MPPSYRAIKRIPVTVLRIIKMQDDESRDLVVDRICASDEEAAMSDRSDNINGQL